MDKGDICKIESCFRVISENRTICSAHRQHYRKYGHYNRIEVPDLLPGHVKFCKKHGQLKPENCLIKKKFHSLNTKITKRNNYYCRECARLRYRRWRERNPNKKREDYLKVRFSKNYIKTGRKLWLKKKFGLTLEQYNEMLEDQKGLCASCDKSEMQINKKSGLVKMLSVDHDHKTGKIRQLLCNRCNIALGVVNDSVEWLEKLIIYLRLHGETEI